jgi:hypothetical protein
LIGGNLNVSPQATPPSLLFEITSAAERTMSGFDFTAFWRFYGRCSLHYINFQRLMPEYQFRVSYNCFMSLLKHLRLNREQYSVNSTMVTFVHIM